MQENIRTIFISGGFFNGHSLNGTMTPRRKMVNYWKEIILNLGHDQCISIPLKKVESHRQILPYALKNGLSLQHRPTANCRIRIKTCNPISRYAHIFSASIYQARECDPACSVGV